LRIIVLGIIVFALLFILFSFKAVYTYCKYDWAHRIYELGAQISISPSFSDCALWYARFGLPIYK